MKEEATDQVKYKMYGIGMETLVDNFLAQIAILNAYADHPTLIGVIQAQRQHSSTLNETVHL